MSDAMPPVAELSLNEQVANRRAKLDALRVQSAQPFPNDFRRDNLASALHQQYQALETDALEITPIPVKLAGRIMTRRLMGKASFVHLQDMSGRMQLYLKQDELPADLYERFKDWDLGDIIGVEGTLFKTKTGELSVRVKNARLLTKALLPMPDKFHGLTDHETRYRQRYLDLIANEESRRLFMLRSAIVSEIRHFLVDKGFLEVETPMMHDMPGGAAARPFKTHHNALDLELYLRIAPELYLKRLVVGGFEKVFEINRNFRNEGLSTRHNPEFTMLEFYQAYADYRDLMDLTEQLMRHITQKVLGTTQITYQGHEYDLAKPFKRMTLLESITHFNPTIDRHVLGDLTAIRALAKSLEISVAADFGIGKIQCDIFEKLVEAKLHEPTFITEYPTEVSPLARKNEKNPLVTDRFEFFVGGREIANGFSELNDPDDQAERFRAQASSREAGDLEAMYYDADYITALEYGLPPTAGEGIGIDRLVMLLTDAPSIRDVILFPQLRPQQPKP